MNEKYLPFFRKYRPQKFSDVIGQEALVKALTNAIELKRIANAYLFCGPRGTGKTSSARIFAKSLNCAEGISVEPCQKCASCVDITNASGLDVIEIDAASNRGIDDAKELISQVQYAPINGRYKIFIIDEVHMLSKDAFNALLKTFEEPPENVIFILATTEPHKVLETIVSRCQRYDFRRITIEDIVKKLKEVANLEKIKITDDALFEIAKSSNGGMRDSLALLDQVAVLGLKEEISREDIESLVGKVSFKPMFELVNAMLSSDTISALNIASELLKKGSEPRNLTDNLIDFLKNAIIVKSAKNKDIIPKFTSLVAQDIELLCEDGGEFTADNLSKLLNFAINFYKNIKSANNPYVWLELLIIQVSCGAYKLNNCKDVAPSAQSVSQISKISQSAPHASLRQNPKTTAPQAYVAPNVKTPETLNTQSTQTETQKEENKPQVFHQEVKNEAEEEVAPQVNAEANVQELQAPHLQTDTEPEAQAPQAQTNSEQEAQMPAQQASAPVAHTVSGGANVWDAIISSIDNILAKGLFMQVVQEVRLEGNNLTVGFNNPNNVNKAKEKISFLQKAVKNVLSNDIQISIIQVPKGNRVIQFPSEIEVNSAPSTQEETLQAPKNYSDDNLPEIETNAQNAQKTPEDEQSKQKNKANNSIYSEKTKKYLDVFNGKMVD